jgi:DNA-binding XRE family transcriptional regulator
MSKYMRSRHIPLKLEEPKSVQEEFNDFSLEIQEAGEILRALRENRGWVEAELGEKVGLDAEHIILMESGKQPIPLVTANMFSKLFKVDYHLFL